MKFTNQKTPQILPTKLFIPSLPANLVPRTRLYQRLEEGLTGKLTLISAPAGYGKSTLLCGWVKQTKLPATWLSLDAGDNNPVRFWTHFVAALRQIKRSGANEIGGALLRLLQTTTAPSRELPLDSLITNIAAISDPFVLIVDDLHLVEEPLILDGLFYLLENFPAGMSGMHIILSSRQDPPWPLARLRVQGQIAELRARDLRLTPQETALFFNGAMQLALEEDVITELEKRTEGWVAGLQMAALSIRGRGDLTGFLRDFSGTHRFVLDYLMEEVLDRQTPEMLDFLLKTSILERLTGDLCTAVTGNQASPTILRRLETANMFLIPLDERRVWYRYHHLFADLLQKHLGDRFPGLAQELHLHASRWYARAGSPREAVTHALQTRDWDWAANQIEAYALQFIQNGEMRLVRQWMHSLPEAVIQPRPALCIARAWTSAQYATVASAETLLEEAETALAEELTRGSNLSPAAYDYLGRQIAVLQVVLSRVRGDSTHIQQKIVLDALDQIAPAQDPASEAALLLRLGFCHLDMGKDTQADQIFSQAFALAESSGNQYAAYGASYGRMVIARRHGNLHQLAAYCQQLLANFQDAGNDRQVLIGSTLIMLGGVKYEWNHLDEAVAALNRGLKWLDRVGTTELLVKGRYMLCCANIALGKMISIPELVSLAENSSPGVQSYAAALEAHIYLLMARKYGGPQLEMKLEQWAEKQQLTLQDQPNYDWEMFAMLVYARVLCYQFQSQKNADRRARLAEVLEFIEAQRQRLQALDWQETLINLYIVSAVILQNLERKAEALSTMAEALTLANLRGYIRTFIDDGRPVQELLQPVLNPEIYPDYGPELLAAAADLPPATGASKAPVTIIPPPEALSKREMQVLRLLNTRLSVPEIAAEIHLAPSTVRTHIQHIYRKLDAHNRVEVLHRAEEMDLL